MVGSRSFLGNDISFASGTSTPASKAREYVIDVLQVPFGIFCVGTDPYFEALEELPQPYWGRRSDYIAAFRGAVVVGHAEDPSPVQLSIFIE